MIWDSLSKKSGHQIQIRNLLMQECAPLFGTEQKQEN